MNLNDNVKYEKEITVLVTVPLVELEKQLLNNNFKLIEEYEMSDIYMVNNNIDIFKTHYLQILKNCVLVRHIENKKLQLVYKKKKYDEKENILEDQKFICPITDKNKAISFMESIGYTRLLTVNNETKVFKLNDLEICVQYINNQFITIEVEGNENETIDDLIKNIEKYNLSYDRSNYFVKKAGIVLKQIIEKICK